MDFCDVGKIRNVSRGGAAEGEPLRNAVTPPDEGEVDVSSAVLMPTKRRAED